MVGPRHVSDRAALEAAIDDDPFAIEPYLVLADLLAAAGDPRGELAQLHHRSESDPDLAPLLRQRIDAEERHMFGDAGPASSRWRLGWLDFVELDLSCPDNRDQLETMFASDGSRFLTELSVALASSGDLNETRESNVPAAVAALAARDRFCLRSLSLVQEYPGLQTLLARHRDWLEPMPVLCGHETDGLWAKLRNLEHLHVGGMGLFHDIDLPRLRHLVIDDVPFCDFGEWKLPRLESLDWTSYWETTGYASDCNLSHLETLWSRELPRLRDLTFRGSFVQDEPLLEHGGARTLVAQLDRLSVPRSMIAGSQPLDRALLEHRAQLRHLSLLMITGVDEDDEVEELGQEFPQLALEEGLAMSSNRGEIGLPPRA